jgi:Tfp pilus assembly protein PilW
MKKDLMAGKGGFTLLETVISIGLFVMAIMLVTSMYAIIQKAYKAGADKAEVTQNARVSLDRMSREIRQAVHFVGNLPNSTTTATSSLEFQDGHDQSVINYIKYYLSGSNLMREYKYYYFESSPSTHVRWYDLSGSTKPSATTTSSVIIGEYFKDINFYGTSTGVNIKMSIEKNTNIYNIETLLYTRN